MLSALSGRTHRVLTAVAAGRGPAHAGGPERLAVHFAPLSTAVIDAYIASGQPFGKAAPTRSRASWRAGSPISRAATPLSWFAALRDGPVAETSARELLATPTAPQKNIRAPCTTPDHWTPQKPRRADRDGRCRTCTSSAASTRPGRQRLPRQVARVLPACRVPSSMSAWSRAAFLHVATCTAAATTRRGTMWRCRCRSSARCSRARR